MIIIDTNRPEGNAFAIIAAARRVAREIDDIDAHALVDELHGCATYAQLLDTIEARMPACFVFLNDPRRE